MGKLSKRAMGGDAADGTGRMGSRSSSINSGELSARVKAGQVTINGADTSWMGPSQPMQPLEQQIAGRQYDYPVAINLNIRPRAEENISFQDLRGLADAYYLVRLAVETRKDQIVKQKWTVKPVDSQKKPDDRCKQLIEFFKSPDKRHNWQDWARMLTEEVLVIDAPALYVRPTIGGQPYAFELMDGATLKLLIDAEGRTPAAPNPAYQQNIKGIPAVDYTTKEIVYKPRNPRVWKMYGYSPVEQIVTIVNMGLRREMSQLQFYTEGNVPEALIGVPNTWNPDQIKAYQLYWDSMFEGNTASRRHAKFVPGGMEVHETKSAALVDAFDEWLARVVQYCFNLPATAYVKQVNKGETTNMKEQAEEEGLVPLMSWFEDLINSIIVQCWGFTDIAFAWEEEKSIDPYVQAQIDQIYLETEDGNGNTVLEANEVRAKLGMEPRDYEAEALERAKKDPANDPKTGKPLPPVAPKEPIPAGTVEPGKEPAEKHAHSRGLKKKTYAKLSDSQVKRAKKLERKFTKFLPSLKAQVISQVTAAYGKSSKAMLNSFRTFDALQKSDVVQNIIDGLDLNFDAIVTVSTKVLRDAAKEGADDAADKIGEHGDDIDTADIAEGVGDVEVGKMITNIDDGTRSLISSDIEDAYEKGLSTGELANILEENYAFSDSRAEAIARTEVAIVDSEASMKTYRESGIVTGKSVLLAEDPCPVCQENADQGIIPLDEPFASGDDTTPFHTRCECDIKPEVGDDEDE